MALTSPALTLALPALFGNIKPALDTVRRIGPTDFSAEAPEYVVAPGATVKVPVASITAASEYNDSTNNYATGGATAWATLNAKHYLQGFDITGVNVDEGVDAGRMRQIFALRAGSGIAAACMKAMKDGLDGLTASTAVTLPGLSATGIDDYQTLGSDVAWLDRSGAVLALNAAEYANVKKVFAAEHVIGTEKELAEFIGFGDLLCVPGLTARAVIVPSGSVRRLARVPTIIAEYREAGVQVDDDSGLAVGIVVANDQARNRVIVNGDVWFGVTALDAGAAASTPGAVMVGTASERTPPAGSGNARGIPRAFHFPSAVLRN